MNMIKKIIEIAKEAGVICMDCRKQGLKVNTKRSAFDFVTSADKKSEEYITQRLKEEFPDYSILTEETKELIGTNKKKMWMVDPLDGTKDFKEGGDGFSVMIGLCIDGKPELGVVYAPARNNTLLYAERGKGAFVECNGKTSKLRVNTESSLANVRLITRIMHGEARAGDRLIDFFEVKEKIPDSSVGLKLWRIASGSAEVHIQPDPFASKWDTCAPQIILEEAGGKITDLYGNELDYQQKGSAWLNGFVATNKILHDAVLNKIKEFFSLCGRQS